MSKRGLNPATFEAHGGICHRNEDHTDNIVVIFLTRCVCVGGEGVIDV